MWGCSYVDYNVWALVAQHWARGRQCLTRNKGSVILILLPPTHLSYIAGALAPHPPPPPSTTALPLSVTQCRPIRFICGLQAHEARLWL